MKLNCYVKIILLIIIVYIIIICKINVYIIIEFIEKMF